MNRSLKTAILSGLVILGLATLAVVAIRMGNGPTGLWTDASSIRVAASGAPVRHILWQPARPVPRAVPGAPPDPEEVSADSRGSAAGGSAVASSAPSADEYEPRLSADGTRMVLVRRRPGQNADLFSSLWTPGGWTEPAPIEAVDTERDELGPELSQDGRSLYFYSDRPGGLGGFDVWVSRLVDSQWGTPTNLGPAINSPWNEYGPALTDDGSRIYFSSNRPRDGEPAPQREAWSATLRERPSRHDYDLYVCDLSSGEPGQAIALAALNTTFDEGAPAISPVGDFLYFASDRPGGAGGYDIYRSRIVRGQLAAPENLGVAVNSAANDLDPGLSTDGFRIYFSSDRPSLLIASPSAPVPGGGVLNSAVYRLWCSGSREVFQEFERPPENRLGALWRDLWPWLVLLIVLSGLAVWVYQFLRSPVWRRRFSRLSLLAQCLLVSLAIHAMLASVLAAWKVGSGIIDLVQRGGGTKVILASSAGSDQLAAQIAGPASDSSIAFPALASISAEVPELRLEAPVESAPVPAVMSVRAAPMANQVAVEAGQSLSVPLELERAPAPSGPDVRAVPAPSSAAPASGEPSLPTVQLAPEMPRALPNGGLSQAPIEKLGVPAPPSVEPVPMSITSPEAKLSEASPVSGDAAAPRPVAIAGASPAAPESPRATSTTTEATVSPATPSVSTPAPIAVSGVSSGDAPTATMAPPPLSIADRDSHSTPVPDPDIDRSIPLAAPTVLAGPLQGHSDRPQPALPTAVDSQAAGDEPRTVTGTAGLTPAAALPAPPPTNGRFEQVQIPPGGTGQVDHDRLPTVPMQFDVSAQRTATALGIAAIPMPSSGVAGAGTARPAIPSIKPGEASSAPEASAAQTPREAIGSAAPIPAGPSARTATASTILNPAPGRPLPDRGSPAALTGSLERDPIRHEPSAVGSAGPGRVQVPAGFGESRLPELPSAPPTPVETFSQRAPEIRDQVLEKMGGSAQTEKAVGLALEWFRRHQESDGRWTGRQFDEHCHGCDGQAAFDADAAMTGMALLCYLGAGHTQQTEGPYRDVVSRALEWLTSRQAPGGDLRHGETMYGQTVATVALCEAYSMTRDPRLADPARRAVGFVARIAAKPRDRRSADEDTSVLGWLVMTMESARRAGIPVPRDTFDAAGKWLDYVSSPQAPGRYSYRKGEPPSLAMTAESMFVQQLIGHARSEPRMVQSAQFILQTPPRWENGAPTYCWYYATLALFQQQGDAWSRWNQAIMPQLIEHQRTDGGAAGSWDPQDAWSRMGGRIYQTAVCTLSLEVYYRYRPR